MNEQFRDKPDASPLSRYDAIGGHATQMLVAPSGSVRCVYTELLDLTKIGRLAISRGSHLEPDDAGRWFADLAPVGGSQLGPFQHRSDALKAEIDWLDTRWLAPTSA